MKKINIAFLVLSMIATSFICYGLNFLNTPNMILPCLWLALPPLLLILITQKNPRIFKNINNAFYVSLAVVGSGLYLLADILYFNPDPSGAVAVVVLPVFQIIEIVLLGVLFKIMVRK